MFVDKPFTLAFASWSEQSLLDIDTTKVFKLLKLFSSGIANLQTRQNPNVKLANLWL